MKIIHIKLDKYDRLVFQSSYLLCDLQDRCQAKFNHVIIDQLLCAQQRHFYVLNLNINVYIHHELLKIFMRL